MCLIGFWLDLKLGPALAKDPVGLGLLALGLLGQRPEVNGNLLIARQPRQISVVSRWLVLGPLGAPGSILVYDILVHNFLKITY